MVEKNLSIHLGQNFDKYNKAFDQFSGMQADLRQMQTSISMQKKTLEEVKAKQV